MYDGDGAGKTGIRQNQTRQWAPSSRGGGLRSKGSEDSKIRVHVGCRAGRVRLIKTSRCVWARGKVRRVSRPGSDGLDVWMRASDRGDCSHYISHTHKRRWVTASIHFPRRAGASFPPLGLAVLVIHRCLSARPPAASRQPRSPGLETAVTLPCLCCLCPVILRVR